jgi:hypothetical protein
MSSTVNIGTIEAILKLTDQLVAPAQDAAKKLDRVTDQMEKDLNSVDKASDGLKGSFKNLADSVGSELVGNFTKMFAVTAIVGGGLAALKSVTQQLVTANIEAEQSARKVEEGIRRYGKSSGVTEDQVNDLAASLSKLTGIDDEAIADAEIMALKYNRIGTDVLPRLTKAAVDLSVATGDDLSSAFEKSAKIINQPLRGLTLLNREGYAVSKSQADMVKNFIKNNDVISAQGVLLGILEGQYGGAAEAARDTMGGAITALGTTWENFLERVGQNNMGPLRNAVESLISLLETATDNVIKFEIGFNLFGSAANRIIASVLDNFADLLELISKGAGMLGRFGVGIKEVSDNVLSKARAGADAARKNVEDNERAIEKSLVSFFKLDEGQKKGKASALALTDAETKLSKAIDKTADSIRLSIAEMQRKADNARNLYLSAILGQKQYNAELLKQKVVGAILQEENKLRESGKKLTESQRNAIAKATIEEDHFDKKLKETLDLTQRLTDSLLTATDNIVARGFGQHFQSELNKVHEGIRLITKDVEEMLSALDIKNQLNLDADFSIRLNAIDEVSPHLRKIEEDYLKFLQDLGSGSVSEGERIFAKMAERFGWTVDEIKAKLGEIEDANLARDFKLQLESNNDPNKKLIELRKTLDRLTKTTDSAGDVFLTAAEAQEIYSRAVTESVQEMLSSTISVVQAFMSMTSESNKWGKAVNGLSGVVASGGTNILAWYEMFVGIAEGFTDKSGIHAWADIGTGATGVELGETWANEELKEEFQKFVDSINETVDSLGGILMSLPDMLLEQKGKGWVVKIEGEVRRYFDDFNDAVAYATGQALANADIAGIDEEIQKALGRLDFDSMDDLKEFLDYANEYTSFGTSELTQGLQSLTQWLLETSRKAIEFGLSIAKVGEEFGRRAQAWRDQILGIVLSPEEKLSRDVDDFNKWIEQEERSARIQIDAAKAQMAAAEIQMNAAWAQIKGSGLSMDPELQKLFLESQKLFNDAAARLDLWTKALDNLPGAITPEEEAEAKKRTRKGGGGNSERDSARDFVKDRTFDLSLVGLGELEKARAELERQYAELLMQAGKDKALREQLLDLKERELALLEQERAKTVVSNFRDFLGLVNPFDQVRKTAEDLISQIEDSPFGDVRKARMIERVLDEVNNQIERMALESAQSLLGSLIGDLEKFGATEEQLLEARQHFTIIEHTLKMINYRQEIEMLRLQGTLSAEVMAVLDKSLATLEGIDPTKFINTDPDAGIDTDSDYKSSSKELNTFDEFLEAKDRILEQLEQWNLDPLGELTAKATELTSAYDKLMVDVEKVKAFGWDFTATAKAAFENAKKAFIDDILSPFEELSKSDFVNDLENIKAQFQDIFSALDKLGASQEDLARAEQARIDAVSRAIDDFIAPLREFREGRQLSNLSTLTGEQQFFEAQAKFRDIDIADVLSGELTIEDIVKMAEQYGSLAQDFTGGSGLQFIMKEIDDMIKEMEKKIPDVAAEILGEPGNPMHMQSPDMINSMNENIAAINNGNTLLLNEMRTGSVVTEMKDQTTKLNQIRQLLASPLTVKNVA